MKIFYQKSAVLNEGETIAIDVCNGKTGDVLITELHIDSEIGGYSVTCASGDKEWEAEKGIDKSDLSLQDTGTPGSLIYIISGADKVTITAGSDDVDVNVKVVF